MKIGADRNKILVLSGLTLVAGYLFYSNVLSEPGGRPRETPPVRAAAPSRAPGPASSPRPAAVRRADGGVPRIQEFKPSLLPKKGEEPDLASIDPTLRFDLLKHVQSVGREGGQRNLFQFTTAPPPPAPSVPAPKIVPKTPQQIAQQQAEQAQAAAQGKAPPPPINLKFYGYLSARAEGHKRAFLLDGDDIFVAEEGDIVKKRYKIVRIGVNSIVVEDMQSSNTQTLPLLMPPAQPGMG